MRVLHHLEYGILDLFLGAEGVCFGFRGLGPEVEAARCSSMTLIAVRAVAVASWYRRFRDLLESFAASASIRLKVRKCADSKGRAEYLVAKTWRWQWSS